MIPARLRTATSLARRAQLAFFGYGLVAVVAATFPLAFQPGGRLPGSELVGAYSHVWKNWWTAHALLHGDNPAVTTMLHHPTGFEVGFFLANFMEGFLALPLTALFGPVVGNNVVLLLTAAAGCWAAALLARDTGLDHVPAAFVGVVWCLAPHFLGLWMGGAYENLPGPWLPLFTLALVRLLRPWRPLLTGRWTGRTADRAAMASLAGVSLWLFALTSWFNGLVLAFYAGVALLVVGVVATRRVLVRVCWALAGLAGGGVAVVLSARALLPIVQTSADDVPLRFSTLNAPFLAMTWKRDATLSELFAHDTLWLNHHLLVTVGLLALLGLSRRWGRWTLLAALPFLVDFALPERWFEDTRLMIPEAWGLVHTAAGWIVGEAQRRLFPVHLLLSLAAGHGLAWAIERVGRWRGPRAARAVPVVALAAWLIESVVAGPVRLPVYSFRPDVAGSSEFLASAPAGAVIDVPLRYDGPKAEIKATQSWYIFQQTVHHQPVMAAVGSRLSFAEMGLPVRDPLLDRIQQVLDGRRVTPLDGWTPDSLRAAGYRWIVLHGPRIDHKVRQPLATTLQEVVGDPAWIGRDQMVFRIPDAGEGEGEGDGRATR